MKGLILPESSPSSPSSPLSSPSLLPWLLLSMGFGALFLFMTIRSPSPFDLLKSFETGLMTWSDGDIGMFGLLNDAGNVFGAGGVLSSG